jgi:hypothetical protein
VHDPPALVSCEHQQMYWCFIVMKCVADTAPPNRLSVQNRRGGRRAPCAPAPDLIVRVTGA